MKILVTGGNGFLGFRLVNYLLEQGHNVIASVRSKDPNKVQKLYNLKDKYSEKITIYTADLMVPGDFDKACDMVDTVMHTATPVILGDIDDYENKMFKPAVEGTQNILYSCLKSSTVKVIVYTSSVGTVAAHSPEPGLYTEANWQIVNKLNDSPYHYSKIQAEKLFLKFIEDNKRFRGVVINPGAIFGPYVNFKEESLNPYQVTDLFEQYLINKVEEHYSAYFTFIDVRDLAKAHLLAAENEEANGRFILVSFRISYRMITQHLREIFPHLDIQDYTDDYDGEIIFDTTKTKNVLGMSFTPWKITVKDIADQLFGSV